jgi:hypothetical protein
MDSEHLVFHLRPDATISGTITDEQSDPVVQAQVFLLWTGVENGATVTRMRAQTFNDDRGNLPFWACCTRELLHRYLSPTMEIPNVHGERL